MYFYPVWPIPCLVLVAVAVASTPCARRFLNDAASNSAGRAGALDGLRGFLSVGVFIHHFSMMRGYLNYGVWVLPPSGIYTLLGQGSVALFFMITGFLFWGKLVDTNGAPGWAKLYIARVFRIGPLYLAVVAVMVGIVFANTGFVVTVPWRTSISTIGTWLCLGMLPGHPDINGYPNTRVLIAGVTWTLHFEWLFYLALLPMSIFAKSRRHLAFAVLGYALCLTGIAIAPRALFTFGALFFAGMTSASLCKTYDLYALRGRFISIVPVTALGILFLAFDDAYSIVPIVLLTVFFIFVASGNSLLGVLLTPSAHRLGYISYSVYLMQGLLITMAFYDPTVRLFALRGPLQYWGLCLVTLLALLVCSAATYVGIEKPGIAFNHRVRRFLLSDRFGRRNLSRRTTI
jgi:peptidoglycan/LPS O-acetylase OafA/YrhL